MKTAKRQQGMTLIGFIIVLGLAIFVAYLGMKIVPIYIDYYSVVQAMDDLKEEPGIARKSPRQIRDLFFRKLYVSYADDIQQSDVSITRTGGLQFNVDYEVRESLIGNLDIVAKFDRTVVLN